jgi:hypothetical protein
MTDTLVEPPRTSVARPDPLRPVRPDRTIAALPRRLIGVREEVLDAVPEERPRYTRLGLILVNTGLMASISLSAALLRVLGVPWTAVIPVALFWGLVVLTIDSWMVASTHGVLTGSRWLLFVPRLVLSILIGTVIAEPLVLWIFHPAIHATILQGRQDDVRAYASQWKACNPETGPAENVAECADFRLPIKSPQEIEDQLAKVTADRTSRSEEISKLAAQLTDKQKFAEAECAGVKIEGTSGDEGKGWRCDNAWRVANTFEASLDLPGKRRELTALDAEINRLTVELANARTAYGRQIESAIATEVDNRADSYRPIDLIDEERGLEQLSSRSNFVFWAHWLVRILLILVDCLPVLAKMLSGTTNYDRELHRQLQARRSSRNRQLEVAESAEQSTADIELSEIERNRDARIDLIKQRRRSDAERHDELEEEEIDRRAARYAEAG